MQIGWSYQRIYNESILVLQFGINFIDRIEYQNRQPTLAKISESQPDQYHMTLTCILLDFFHHPVTTLFQVLDCSP